MRLFLFFIFLIAVISSCTNKKNKTEKKLNYDSSRIAILSTSDQFHRVFNEQQYQPSDLTQQELTKIDSLFLDCIQNYNRSLNSTNFKDKIVLRTTTKIQMVVATDQKGKKIVWINCMCREIEDWRKRIIKVDDGGACFFNFKIDLTEEKHFDLAVNGAA